jgi:hypothetical protein
MNTKQILAQARNLRKCLVLEERARKARDNYRQKFEVKGFFASYGMDAARISEALNLTLMVPVNTYLEIHPEAQPKLHEWEDDGVKKVALIYPEQEIGKIEGATVWMRASFTKPATDVSIPA